MNEKIPLLVVAGPTASGKTSLGVALAKALDGEVISADSMQIYKGMDIATAKPTVEEMEGIPHHLMDFQPADEPFSLADYLTLAKEKVEEVYKKGKLPIMVGGTGLYISSFVDHIEMWEGDPDPDLRQELLRIAAEKGNGYLLEELRSFDPETAARLHENNLTRIVRAIEVYRVTGETMAEKQRKSRLSPSPYDPCMLALNYRDRQTLYRRIDKRVDLMVEMGLIEEAKEVLSKPLSTAAQAIGYKELAPYFAGEKPLHEALEQLKLSSRRYAKRQLSWFRRDERIHWLYPDEEESFEALLEHALKIVENSGILRRIREHTNNL